MAARSVTRRSRTAGVASRACCLHYRWSTGEGTSHDVIKEARLLPLDTIVKLRCAKHYLEAKVRGNHLAEVTDHMFLLEHSVHIELGALRGSYSTVDDFNVRQTHGALRHAKRVYFNCRLPGGLNADADEALKRAACMRRAR